MVPNLFAWIALWTWPLAVLAFFASRRRSARIARTTAWMMIVPEIFLPADVRLAAPGALHKHHLAFLSVWAALQLFHHGDLRAHSPSRRFPRTAILVLMVGAFLTVRTNAEALTFGPLVLPGLGLGDWAAMVLQLLLSVYLPFVVGQQVFRTERDLRDLLEVLVACGLMYAPLCALELRLSPQLHRWVYGFSPSDFVESLRGSGYRPTVFMDNGLAVAMFCFTAFASAFALLRARLQVGRFGPTIRAVVLGALVLASRSLGAILYTLVTAVLNAFCSPRAMFRFAALLAVLVIAYPILRIVDVFPTDDIIAVFDRADPVRARSLAFRFRNEDALVARTLQKPLFGWGHYARGWVYEPNGTTSTTIDGLWVAQLNGYGLVGFFGFFVLIVVPLFRCGRHRARMSASQQALVGTLAVIVALYGIESLPNSMYDFLPIAYAGALHTLATGLVRRGTTPATTLAHNTQPASPVGGQRVRVG